MRICDLLHDDDSSTPTLRVSLHVTASSSGILCYASNVIPSKLFAQFRVYRVLCRGSFSFRFGVQLKFSGVGISTESVNTQRKCKCPKVWALGLVNFTYGGNK